MKNKKPRNSIFDSPVFLGFYIEEDTRDALKKCARNQGDTLSRLIRSILEEAAAKLERKNNA